MSQPSSFQKRRRAFYGVSLGFIVGCAVALAQYAGVMGPLERLGLNLLYRARGQPEKVVLKPFELKNENGVELRYVTEQDRVFLKDYREAVKADSTIQNLRKLPKEQVVHKNIRVIGVADKLDRTKYAQLVNRLVKAGVRVIAFDVIFPSKTEEEAEKEPTDLATLSLIKAFSESGRVILPVYRPRKLAGYVQQSWPYTESMVIKDNDPAITSAAMAVGHFNVDVEEGVVRSVPFGIKKLASPKRFMHMGLLAGLIYAGRITPGDTDYHQVIAKEFQEKGLLDAKGRYYPRLSQPPVIPLTNIYEMLEDRDGNREFDAYFRDSLVLIGQTAQGEAYADQWDSPYGVVWFGLFFHVSGAMSALTGDYFRPLQDNPWFMLVSIFGSIMVCYLASQMGALASMLVGMVVLGGYVLGCALFAIGYLGPPTLLPMAGFFVTISVDLVGIFFLRTKISDRLVSQREREIEVLQAEDQYEQSERIDVRNVDRQIAQTAMGQELKADWCVVRQKIQGLEGDEETVGHFGEWQAKEIQEVEQALSKRAYVSGQSEILTHVSAEFPDCLNTTCPSAMAVPMRDGPEVIGTVVVGGKLRERFRGDTRYQEGDQQFFRALAREWSDRIVIAQYNRTLEDRVHLRTLDLQMANNRLSELDRQKSDFMNMVAHDLRTPLTSIRSYAEIMLTYKDEPPETYEEFLTIINDESVRLNGLIDNFLDLSRIESGSFQLDIEALDISKLIDHALAVFRGHAEPKSIKLESQIPDGLPNIMCDGDRIAQVLANLLSNALKFTPEGGEVRVIVSSIDSETHPGEPMAKITVADTGPGIPGEARETIFRKFGQVDTDDETIKATQRKGTGLGLPLCLEFVEKHQGQIWVESEVGNGSQFHFTLFCEGCSLFQDEDEVQEAATLADARSAS
jgi:signal transduction histidine kinase/CHASE2 domain-containing sensor protein